MLVRSIASLYEIDYLDLDGSTYRDEKKRLIEEIAPPREPARGGLPGASAARLTGPRGQADIVIWPVGGERGGALEKAWLLLSYQLGRSKPTLSHLVVARDAEEYPASTALRGLLDSLTARLPCVRGAGAPSRGYYYAQIDPVCGKPLSILLIVQSLEHVGQISRLITQHAIKDFIIYLSLDKLSSLLSECPRLMEAARSRHGHKKLAALAAIDSCRPGIDEKLLDRLLTPRAAEELCRIHDGLEKLCTAITQG